MKPTHVTSLSSIRDSLYICAFLPRVWVMGKCLWNASRGLVAGITSGRLLNVLKLYGNVGREVDLNLCGNGIYEGWCLWQRGEGTCAESVAESKRKLWDQNICCGWWEGALSKDSELGKYFKKSLSLSLSPVCFLYWLSACSLHNEEGKVLKVSWSQITLEIILFISELLLPATTKGIPYDSVLGYVSQFLR